MRHARPGSGLCGYVDVVGHHQYTLNNDQGRFDGKLNRDQLLYLAGLNLA